MPKELIEARRLFFSFLDHAEYVEQFDPSAADRIRENAEGCLECDIRLFELANFKRIAA